MKRRTYTLLAIAAFSLTLAACHKTCTCSGYDALPHTFTADEVRTHAGGDCTDMRNFPVPNQYSVCNWD